MHPSVIQKIKDSDGDFNDPLKWWSVSEVKYPRVAKLAEVFLPAPATSAPSERVWKRSSDVLTIKRANLAPFVASGIMFTKENIRLVYKHYEKITGRLLSEVYLPVYDGMMEEFDCGQDDHHLAM